MPKDLKVLAFPTPAPKKKKKLRKYERADGRFCKVVTVNSEKLYFYVT